MNQIIDGLEGIKNDIDKWKLVIYKGKRRYSQLC